MSDWALTGTYLEACNCDAICPCRRIGGRAGGRSTHGICMGALSWRIETGHADGVELAGLEVVLATSYSDDEPGSPWTYHVYVDERAEGEQREALSAIFTGRLGGTASGASCKFAVGWGVFCRSSRSPCRQVRRGWGRGAGKRVRLGDEDRLELERIARAASSE